MTKNQKKSPTRRRYRRRCTQTTSLDFFKTVLFIIIISWRVLIQKYVSAPYINFPDADLFHSCNDEVFCDSIIIALVYDSCIIRILFISVSYNGKILFRLS